MSSSFFRFAPRTSTPQPRHAMNSMHATSAIAITDANRCRARSGWPSSAPSPIAQHGASASWQYSPSKYAAIPASFTTGTGGVPRGWTISMV